MKMFLCAGRLSCIRNRKQVFVGKNRNIVNTQRVSAFGIFYYEPESGSYKRDDNGKYMGNR